MGVVPTRAKLWLFLVSKREQLQLDSISRLERRTQRVLALPARYSTMPIGFGLEMQMHWKQPKTSGDKPTARSGHTLSLCGEAGGSRTMVMFGGCFAEPAGPTDDRHDAHVASKVHVIHRNGPPRRPQALGRHDGRHRRRAARGRVLLVSFTGVIKKVRSSKQRATWRPRDRGQSPRAMQWAWPRSACTSRSYSSCLGCRVRGPRRIVRSMQGSLA